MKTYPLGQVTIYRQGPLRRNDILSSILLYDTILFLVFYNHYRNVLFLK